MGVPENNGVPQQTTGTVEQSHAQQQTAPTHDPVSPLANDNAITSTQPQAHSVAPPAYEKAPNSEQPGVPRNDDPARVEANRGPQQQQQLAPPAIATPLQNLREDSAWIDCPFCHQRSVTDPRKIESDTTWIYTLLCCLCCGCIGAIFPLIFKWGADTDHWCKTCNNRVARIPHEGGSGAPQIFGPQALAGPAPMQHQQPVKHS